jgi:5-methylcytosine-specific restriction endonuclease McrA
MRGRSGTAHLGSPSLSFSEKFFCCDCGKETERKVGIQIRCAECRPAAEKLAHRGYRKKNKAWKRQSGVHCSRCCKPTGKPGICDECRAYVASWKLLNRGKVSLLTAKRRGKVSGATGELSPGLPQKLLTLQRGRCAYCEAKLANDYHMDHIEPLALGGQNVDENIQLLCAFCNLSKGAKHPVEFAQRRGLLL